MLTGADSSFGIPAVRLVRRAGKRKTLYVIMRSLIAAFESTLQLYLFGLKVSEDDLCA
jgi:hypothetical protein